MSEQSLPDGVERYSQPVVYADGGSVPLVPTDDGPYLRHSDLPKIIDQAKREEWERLKEALQAVRLAALDLQGEEGRS